MMYDLGLEMRISIRNVLDSDFTTKEISEACDISQTTINELRNKKREIGSTSFQNAYSLYRFAIVHKLDSRYLNKQEMKGNISYISLDINISKVIVSFEEYDLLAYGILKNISRKNDSPNRRDKLITNEVSTAVFVTKDGCVYDCEEFGYQFKCRYGGTGPNNFVDFLEEYTKMNREKLEEVIFNSSVVEYNFENDTITGFPAVIKGRPFQLYSFNEKLILFLNCYDNSFGALRRYGYNIDLLSAATEIKFLASKLSEAYNLSTKIKDVTYIPKCDKDSKLSIKQLPRYNRFSNDVSIIIDYGAFEFWLPYRIHQEKGDIFENEEMLQLLEGLDLSYNPEKKSFIQTYFDSKEPIEKAIKLSIQYEDDM
ncbi:hypothetical protein [Enterococcus faecalis]|uniref:hypothetical protein n=1 Tax=Enterococcus faecalis TaxID=1351 RepID=UPI000CF22C5D|nr:hypothetical protein [Enterococcus faecalis]EKZ0363066.1 hypothetical protein [Enterococcus faecalis]PQD30691.1 hypothetical protein CUM64_12800 [Enterococcus faecalis]RBR39518.1 hypothetical protein EA76_02781 [Enterococcus faecalis]